MTASDAMERENKIERQLKDASKEIEELRGKLSQGPRQNHVLLPMRKRNVSLLPLLQAQPALVTQ